MRLDTLVQVCLFSTVMAGVAGCALPAFEKIDHSPLPNDPIAVVAGGVHSAALFRQGNIKCWGGNDAGQLGLGDTANRGDGSGEMGSHLSYVNLSGRFGEGLAAGGRHVCALLPDDVGEPGVVGCWGSNEFGQLGSGVADNMNAEMVLANLAGGRKARAVTAGSNHSCALLDDSSIKCWGMNDFGQLGLGDQDNRGRTSNMAENLPVVDIGGRRAGRVSAGGNHTCAVIGGDVACWGSNDSGQLGVGSTEDRGTDPSHLGKDIYGVLLGQDARSVSAGGSHTCALLADGSIKCWGANGDGQLGIGDTDNRGDQPDELGDALPAVNLGRAAIQVAAGNNFSCALLNNGQVKCWGANDVGQLGVGDTARRGINPSQMGDALPPAELGAEATSISAGGAHACALLETEEVKCWGANGSGQLGLGNTAARGDGSGEMGSKLPVVPI